MLRQRWVRLSVDLMKQVRESLKPGSITGERAEPGKTRDVEAAADLAGDRVGGDAKPTPGVGRADRPRSEPRPPASGGLEVMGICKRFGSEVALDDLSLTVRQGEVVGLFGRDGAGKTLCFEAIMGLTKIRSGRILLDGQDITRLTVSRRGRLGLSYLLEEPSIFRGMTTAQNISAVLEHTVGDPALREQRLDSLLDEFSIGYVRDVPSSRLSGGERRRCEVARLMAISPIIMLMDEPFAGIDPMAVNSIKGTIRKLRGMNVGILIADQNLREALRVVDRVYVIHQGAIIFEGSPQDMLADSDVRRFYLGEHFSLTEEIWDQGEWVLPVEPGQDRA